MSAGFFVAELEASELTEPRQGAFGDIASLAQATPMGAILRSCQLGLHAARLGGGDVVLPAIGSIPLNDVGAESRTPAGAWDRGNGIEHPDRHRTIWDIGGGGLDHQGDSIGRRDPMAFAAAFPSIRGVRAGVRPPKTARTEALSITPRERLIFRRRPKRFRSRWWISGHRPASVQSLSRRQQVTPLPQPNSAGSIFHGIPDRKTMMIPVRQSRSGTGGRPPWGLGFGGGNRGWISFHTSSASNVNAMMSPPVLMPRHSHIDTFCRNL